MTARIKLELHEREYEGLAQLSLMELRSAEDQLRYLLRAELRRRELLPAESGTSPTSKGVKGAEAP